MNGTLPPLTKVFRPGAARQRLRKGYIVDDAGRGHALAKILAPGSRAQARASEFGLKLHGSAQAPNSFWIDTGLIWLNQHDAREKLARAMHAVLREVSSSLADLGGRLLPSAVRLDGTLPWHQLVCEDGHFIETSCEREKTAFCNLLRFHLPELLALTGRAGASPAGVERVGSRRLSESRRHVPARAFASLSREADYLDHVLKSLARDGRVEHMALLDIDPHVEDDSSGLAEDACVELRFVDAQLHVRTALAHALLFEALLIRARRITLEDKRVPHYPQSRFERDRARAIQHGLQARFTPRSPAESDDYPFSTPPEERGDAEAFLTPAPLRLLRLFDDLSFEFLALDAHYRHLAPIVLGLKLRQWGNLSVQNENDLLQSALGGASNRSAAEDIRDLLFAEQEPLLAFNERFGDHARDIKADWVGRLTLGGSP